MGMFSKFFKGQKEEEIEQSLNPEPEIDPESEIVCSMHFEMTKNGDILAECEWDDSSLFDFAQLIATLNTGQLLPEILSIIKDTCNDSGSKEEYKRLLGFIYLLTSKEATNNLDSSTNPLIKPTQVINPKDEGGLAGL